MDRLKPIYGFIFTFFVFKMDIIKQTLLLFQIFDQVLRVKPILKENGLALSKATGVFKG